ncbi:MAG: hypothetical protein ACI8QC_002191 [Planctomycetota bacterium]|jgi:hypothetical protein
MTTPQALLIQDATKRLTTHALYEEITSVDQLRIFLEHHVICVLDFMTLLKRLQHELTCTTSPWLPVQDEVSARLINEIVLDEECDETFGTHPSSHYRWYLAAMEEVGANTAPIREFESYLRLGMEPSAALQVSTLPSAAKAFAQTTFELAEGPVHVVVSSFVWGREDIMPLMFEPLVRKFSETGIPCDLLLRYLKRHIAIDSEEHGPAARRLLERLLGQDVELRTQAYGAAEKALRAREELWDAVVTSCRG